MTAIYSLLHMLVDGVCALSMFGFFLEGEDGYFAMLLYNFCAFALQMPMGTLLDLLILKAEKRREAFAFGFAALGVIVTLAGAFLHPVILGMGNALFHIGGGVGTIYEDRAKQWNGRGLGVFVAPGALGLYLGTTIAKKGAWNTGIVVAGALLLSVTFFAGIWYKKVKYPVAIEGRIQPTKQNKQSRVIILTLCCFLVVILRSYIGIAVTFPWKQVTILGLISVLAVVGGKVAGGFFAAKYGHLRTAVITLLLAGLGYIGLGFAPLGLAALFLFNMTMPMTLYLLISALPRLPGFSFGLLTFGLFLGFLPEYFDLQLAVSGQGLGLVGSLVSMIILVIGIRIGGKQKNVSA